MWVAMYLLCLGFLAIVGEGLVRVAVPPERFWAVANVYRATADADVGYTLRPNFAGTAFGVPLHSNRLGFRGPEWTTEKSEGTFRIALLGDSHAFGYGVPFEQTVGQELTRRATGSLARNHEVLNFAISGYNSQQQLAVLRRYVPEFGPDLIILMPSNNDHEPMSYVNASGYLQRKGLEAPAGIVGQLTATAMTTVHGVLVRSRLYLLARLVVQERFRTESAALAMVDDPSWMRQPIPGGSIPESLRTSVMEPLRQLIAEARDRHVPIILAPFADPPEYRRLFTQLAREERVPLVELLTLLPEARSWRQLLDSFGLGWDPHLNATAHARWAQGLLPLIEAEARPMN